MTTPSGSGLPYRPLDWAASPHDFSGDNQLGIYAEETTQRFIPGIRFTRWDGSVFKYSRLKGTSRPSRGIFNGAGVTNIAVDATNNPAVGSRTLTFDLGGDDGYGGGGVAENELVGAYIITGHGESKEQSRLIMENTAAAISTSITVTIDGPWSDTMTTDTTPWTEITLNPYNYLKMDLGDISSCMGVPCCIATTGYYIWIQSFGPCYMDAHYQIGNGAKERSVYVQANGSVLDGSQINIEDGQQMIGHILDQSDSGVTPWVMLQISI